MLTNIIKRQTILVLYFTVDETASGPYDTAPSKTWQCSWILNTLLCYGPKSPRETKYHLFKWIWCLGLAVPSVDLLSMSLSFFSSSLTVGTSRRHEIQHNEIQRKDIHRDETQHNEIQLNDTQHNGSVLKLSVVILDVTYSYMPLVPNVVMPNVVVPDMFNRAMNSPRNWGPICF